MQLKCLKNQTGIQNNNSRKEIQMAEKKRDETELIIDNFSEFSIEITELFKEKGDSNESNNGTDNRQPGSSNFDNSNNIDSDNNNDEKVIGLF